jgi:hypothetical protein
MRTLRAMTTRMRAHAFDAQASTTERAAERVKNEKRREYLRRALALGAASSLPWRFERALAAAPPARVAA